jgi:hypothetical protein
MALCGADHQIIFHILVPISGLVMPGATSARPAFNESAHRMSESSHTLL